jgi:hypothetical protein
VNEVKPFRYLLHCPDDLEAAPWLLREYGTIYPIGQSADAQFHIDCVVLGGSQRGVLKDLDDIRMSVMTQFIDGTYFILGRCSWNDFSGKKLDKLVRCTIPGGPPGLSQRLPSNIRTL